MSMPSMADTAVLVELSSRRLATHYGGTKLEENWLLAEISIQGMRRELGSRPLLLQLTGNAPTAAFR